MATGQESLRLHLTNRRRLKSQRGQEASLFFSPRDKNLTNDVPFPNALSRAIFYNKYSRWNDQAKRRETKSETINRSFNFLEDRFVTRGGVWLPSERTEVLTKMHALESLPSMRLLWSAGPAAARNNIMLYNCSFMAVNRLDAFSEALYILMAGTGVGYSVEGEFVDALPRIKKQKGGTPIVHVIGDTTEGWADAVREGVQAWWTGGDVVYDASEVRPEGSRLITKGGRSSGPQPLLNALAQIRALILARQGRNATTLLAHDIMCLLAQVVVVGGIRRSSLISLGDLDDIPMRQAKQGEFWRSTPWRSMSNNSAAYNTKPTVEEFLDEWTSLIKGKSGERGMFNRAAFRATSPRRKKYGATGTNPCLTGDTMIATLDGPRSFKDLADDGRDVMVYSWDPATKKPVVRPMCSPRKTGENVDILEVEFDSGLKLRLTPTHSLYTFRGAKIMAQDLRIGQSVRAFSMSQHRDGHLRVHNWDSANNTADHQWVARMVYESHNGSIAEGNVVHHLNEYKLDNRIENLISVTALEHNQEHYLQRLENGFHHPNGKKQDYLDKYALRNHKVLAIRSAGQADVYNGTVDDSHTYIVVDPTPVAGVLSGIVSANCGEINLRDQQFCNLSEIVCRPHDDRNSLAEKIRVATILGTLQASFTDFPYISDKWRENCVEEALLGVSATGQMDCPAFRDADVQRYLKSVAIEVNKDFAHRIDISQSAAITCTKPSGTASILVNSASGQHTRWAKFYKRRIRLNSGDPMLQMFRDCGMVVNPDPVTPGTFVVDFLMKSPEGAITRHDLTALQQLAHWHQIKTNFTEHNPSATIYVKDAEWLAVGNWVYENWNIIGGLSFLPSDDHIYPLAPHEEISESEYYRLLESFPQLDDEQFAKALATYEVDDMTTGATEFACSGSGCEI